MNQIQTERLTLGYNGKTIISGFDITAQSGEIVGIIGPNGAGKTTILRALAGLMIPRDGAALLNGENIQHLSAADRARSIGLVPQAESHAWPISVEDIVMMGRTPHRGWFMPFSGKDHQFVGRVLQQTGLTDFRHRSIDKLSGGERQRVMIARALAQNPKVMLLDEPTASLDIHHQIQVLSLVRQLVEQQSLLAIIAIHDLTLAARFCDRLVLLYEGQAFAIGTPAEVLKPHNLKKVFGIEAQLYRDPYGQWALSVHTTAHERQHNVG
jgi:iron complex transport system ATP-binding protein